MCREVPYIGGVCLSYMHPIYIEREWEWIEIGWWWCLWWQWRKRALDDSSTGTLLAYYSHTYSQFNTSHFCCMNRRFRIHCTRSNAFNCSWFLFQLCCSATRFRSYSQNNINSQGANHFESPDRQRAREWKASQNNNNNKTNSEREKNQNHKMKWKCGQTPANGLVFVFSAFVTPNINTEKDTNEKMLAFSSAFNLKCASDEKKTQQHRIALKLSGPEELM